MADASNQSGGVDFTGKQIDVNGNVVGRDNLESTTNNYYGTTPNAEPIHNSLPNQPYFFGRAAELADACEKAAAVIDDPTAIDHATGPSGVQPKYWLTPGVWMMPTSTAAEPTAAR